MEGRLTILNLEDNSIDAELIHETLRDVWEDCMIERVDNEAAFVRSLKTRAVDVILADYALPGFDGMAALEDAKKYCPDTPFILVSGTLGEEAAIDSLKNGATDYVLKQRLFRLVPAVKRALREHADRRARQEAEKKLHLAARQWQVSFDAMAYGVSIHSADRTILNINREACRLLGKSAEEVIGKKCFQVFHGANKPVAGCPMEKSRFSRHQEYDEMYEPSLDKWFAVSTSPVLDENGALSSMVHTIYDISPRKAAEKEKLLLESQLRHAQKMEALGTLAGGIAHDFNNVLNVIIGYGSIAKAAIHRGTPIAENLNEMLAAAEKASQLVKRLLIFSRKEKQEVKPLNAAELITGFQKMLLGIIGEDIALTVNVQEKNLPIMGDSFQIEQVLMNLVTNARDAMPKGGNLTITAGRMKMDNEFISTHGYGIRGEFAKITVSDTGCGLHPEIMKKIFEPFFTTKEFGKGTGLGLSISYGIVKQHGGYLDVASKPAEGASFIIYLPLMEDLDLKAGESVPPVLVQGKGEIILVAEDDPALRRLIRIVLESSGYRVIMAEDGEAAVDLFKENQEKIQLVMLDMMMPKKSGSDAHAEIRAVSPGMKTLLSSGYPEEMTARLGADGGTHFIRKPFAPSALLQKIREILDT